MSAAQTPYGDRADERAIALEFRRDGVAIVTLDESREPLNILTAGFRAQLGATISRIEEDASIAAAVLVSGRADGFLVGETSRFLTSIKFATDAERMASELGQVLRRLEGLRKPVVAAVHGSAMGGGFEIALACHAIVASSDPRTVLGLPDVRIGLIPPANGLLRVAARAGLRAAIDLGLHGQGLRAADAMALGLVDDVCSRAILVDAAVRHAKGLVGHALRPRDGRGGGARMMDLALEGNPVARHVLFKKARERASTHTRGQSPAPHQILDVLERFVRKGFDAAAELEAKAFGELVVSETAHRLIELSFATRALELDPGLSDKADPRQVRQVAVIGGGTIGRGVAYVTVLPGLPVRLKESDDKAAGLALRSVRTLLDARISAQQLTAREGEQAFSRLSGTVDFSGIRNADIVIEAVPEDLVLKRAILRDVEGLVDRACVFGSSTASIPIAKIAQTAAYPDRVLGMHYFAPVSETPLLEIVRAERTAPWAVATAVAFGKKQGKTVIVVKDGPGFFTTRVLAPLLMEAVQLVSEGVAADAVDAAMVEWGFPVGPIRLLDAIGIDVVAQVFQGLHGAFGSRMTPPGSLAKLLADERKGQKNGRGFYRYARETHEGGVVVDASVYEVLGVAPRTRLPGEEVQMRCALALINEAVRCVGDGVLRGAADGDVGAVFGLGFPRFRGGPFRYVDTIGAADVLRRIQSYSDRFGERWRPAPLLVQLAKKGDRFFS